MKAHVVQLVEGLVAGGLERVVLDLSAGLVNRGARVTICCYDALGPLAQEASAAGIDVQLLPRRAGVDLRYIGRLARALTQWQADALHMHNSTALFYGSLAARKARLPIRVYTEHDGVFPRSSLNAWVNRRLVKRLTKAVAVSQAVKDLWCSHDRINPDSVGVIYNGVATNHETKQGIGSAKKGTGSAAVSPCLSPFSPGPLNIVCVGRLSHEKGVDVLLDAMTLVPPNPPWRLTIVGDGPLRHELEAMAKRLGVTCEFLGWRQDVPQLLRQMDLLVLPSRSEGLPLALLEAMAAGLPAAATDVGGVREAAQADVTALLTPAQNPPALAAAILRLLGDVALRTRMGQAAAERFNRCFELSKMIDAYAELLLK